MSRFYASIRGSAKTQATRRGNKKSGIIGHIRGWNSGIQVVGYVAKDGTDHFCVSRTGGSNDSTTKELIVEVHGGENERHTKSVPAN